MLDFQKKKRLRQILYSPIVVGCMVAIALYALYSTFQVFRKYMVSRRELAQSQQSLLALDQKSTTLDQQIADLRTPEGVENEIRNKYGMAKPGEDLAVVLESNYSTSTASTTVWWQKLLDFFGL